MPEQSDQHVHVHLRDRRRTRRLVAAPESSSPHQRARHRTRELVAAPESSLSHQRARCRTRELRTLPWDLRHKAELVHRCTIRCVAGQVTERSLEDGPSPEDGSSLHKRARRCTRGSSQRAAQESSSQGSARGLVAGQQEILPQNSFVAAPFGVWTSDRALIGEGPVAGTEGLSCPH